MWLRVTGTLSRSTEMLHVKWRITLTCWQATFPSKMPRRVHLGSLPRPQRSFLVKRAGRVIDGMDINQAWHRELGHAEYRITITMAGYGADEDAADAFLEGFLEKHPETGPVVSRNRGADTISVTFSLKASGQEHALKLGRVVWAEGGAGSGLEPTRVRRAEIEPVEDAAEDQDQADERVPA
jgi:hypothetical protein